MSGLTTTVEQLWADGAGKPAKTKLQFAIGITRADINTNMTAAEALLGAISECGIAGAIATLPVPETLTYASSTVQDGATAMDKAKWQFVDDKGNKFFNETPALPTTMLLADGLTVDQADTDVAAWLAWFMGHCESPYGEAIISLYKAYRTFKNRKAKNR